MTQRIDRVVGRGNRLVFICALIAWIVVLGLIPVIVMMRDRADATLPSSSLRVSKPCSTRLAYHAPENLIPVGLQSS